MSNNNPPRADYGDEDYDDDDIITEVREVHALSSPHPSSSTSTSSHRITPTSSSLQSSTSSGSENLPSLSREFSAMVVAGSNIQSSTNEHNSSTTQDSDAAANLGRIREEEHLEETNPLAIVPDNNPVPSPRRTENMNTGPSSSSLTDNNSSRSIDTSVEEVSVHKVKKEEVESKISAWQTAEIAKINNRFKRQDVIISGWENEQIEKSTAWLKKVERKLEEQRARAEEKMKNDVAKARRKAEEKRASAEAKRGTKVAKVLELSSLLRTVGRAPSKRSIF